MNSCALPSSWRIIIILLQTSAQPPSFTAPGCLAAAALARPPACGAGRASEKGRLGEGTDGKTPSVFFQVPWPLRFPPRQPERMQKSREKVREEEGQEGIQAAATSGYVSTSVFHLLEKKNCPQTTPHPCHCLFHTKFQDPEQNNPKVLLHPFGEERVGDGGPCFFRSWGWGVGGLAGSASGC